ncbi:MAG: DEAD/DEAH box helicase family protein [Christensenellaceae bacterium]|jgi:type I restriction enzyme R subunit|nr:DEAD/DEAH box helicase family protein [Christensenellaceae bacterium]
MKPEESARAVIDNKLEEAGYILQDLVDFDISIALGVVVREYPTNSGPVDYAIFIDGHAVGIVEAKRDSAGESLLSVTNQTDRYAQCSWTHISERSKIRFVYTATSIITFFRDKDDDNRDREVYTFHTPEKLKSLFFNDAPTIRQNMKKLHDHPFDKSKCRDCQIDAITKLEDSFKMNKPRALIGMASGAGKTFTAITAVYRLLSIAKINRVLFLVDTRNLAEQAEQAFRGYKPDDSQRYFHEIYTVQRLSSHWITNNVGVCISTIQLMYSILKNEDSTKINDIDSLNEQYPDKFDNLPEVTVGYNSKYPIDFFDVIIIDECHRSIYNIWKQVLDYFDAFLIGLTATPDDRTKAFFNSNLVSEYTHVQAVKDHVNVPRIGTFIIKTRITSRGGILLKGPIEKRVRNTRKLIQTLNDKNIIYSRSELDRTVVNKHQIRLIIKRFISVLPDLFPKRENVRSEVPKTLIFAKSDSHADDIVSIIREEFTKDNDFCKKITYSVDNAHALINRFRNEYNPRIVVTVDMISTGTDVKCIECLLFMRDVRSRSYYEQMLGRGTRTIDLDELQIVSPSAFDDKTGFIVVDAVGVTESFKKTDLRQLEYKRNYTLEQLINSVLNGKRDAKTLVSIANRLIILDRKFDVETKKKLAKFNHGSLKEIASKLLNCFEKKHIESETTKNSKGPSDIKQMLINEALTPIFDSEFTKFLLDACKNYQTMDYTQDEIVQEGFVEDLKNNADKHISTFHDFIIENKDKIDALSIIYNCSYRTRHLTYAMIDEMYEILIREPYSLTRKLLWDAYNTKHTSKIVKQRTEDKLADIVSLIRFELKHTSKLEMFSTEVADKFKKWTFKIHAGDFKFDYEQMRWLRKIKDHISVNFNISWEDLETSPFSSDGGIIKFKEVFSNVEINILEELNNALVA